MTGVSCLSLVMTPQEIEIIPKSVIFAIKLDTWQGTADVGFEDVKQQETLIRTVRELIPGKSVVKIKLLQAYHQLRGVKCQSLSYLQWAV